MDQDQTVEETQETDVIERPQLYYIVCRKHVGLFGSNFILFWGENYSGYTQDIRYAGKYEENDIKSSHGYPICRSIKELRMSGEENVLVPIEVIHDQCRVFHLVEVG